MIFLSHCEQISLTVSLIISDFFVVHSSPSFMSKPFDVISCNRNVTPMFFMHNLNVKENFSMSTWPSLCPPISTKFEASSQIFCCLRYIERRIGIWEKRYIWPTVITFCQCSRKEQTKIQRKNELWSNEDEPSRMRQIKGHRRDKKSSQYFIEILGETRWSQETKRVECTYQLRISNLKKKILPPNKPPDTCHAFLHFSGST